MSLCYTVGIKRRFLPGYRKFKVTAHEWDTTRIEQVLVLTLANGGFVSCGMHGREMRVYADYHQAQREQVPHVDVDQIRAEVRREVEETVLAELRQLQGGGAKTDGVRS